MPPDPLGPLEHRLPLGKPHTQKTLLRPLWIRQLGAGSLLLCKAKGITSYWVLAVYRMPCKVLFLLSHCVHAEPSPSSVVIAVYHKFREVQWLAQGYIANEWWIYMIPGVSPFSSTMLLPADHCRKFLAGNALPLDVYLIGPQAPQRQGSSSVSSTAISSESSTGPGTQ